jgi:bisphosphoglycerate-independent phosphoglycerate mutase (AlkP superfamily)
MVGHTGDIKATVVACKAADEAVKVRMFFFFFLTSDFAILVVCGVGNL